MSSWSKRGLIYTFCALATAGLAGSVFTTAGVRLSAQAAAPSQAAPKPQMAEEIYKNVQVLKGIPVDEFIGTMGVFSTSLTLCCGNCHTGAGTENPKWEDDAPPRKKITRTMIRMVQDINKRSFQGRPVVTCWTCHRGQTKPAQTAPLDFAYDPNPVFYQADVLMHPATGGVPSVDEVFAQYEKALGGAAATNALTSYVAKGTSMLWGEIGKGSSAELYAKAPANMAAFIHEDGGDVARTFDGTTAWFQLPLTVTPQYQLTNTLQEGAKFEAAMAFPWRVRSFFTNWRVSTPDRIDNVEVNVVQGSTPTGMIGTLYFDKQTGLLKRMIRYENTVVGRVPIQVDYSDYRPVAGVQMPFGFYYTWVSQREVWTLTDYQANVSIDAAKFGRPANQSAAR